MLSNNHRVPGQASAPTWTRLVNFYEFNGEYLSADGYPRRGIPPMTPAAMSEALISGRAIRWCSCRSRVLAELEKMLGTASEVSRTHHEGSGSYASSSGYEYSFQESDLVLVAAPIGDFCGQDLYLMASNRFDSNS